MGGNQSVSMVQELGAGGLHGEWAVSMVSQHSRFRCVNRFQHDQRRVLEAHHTRCTTHIHTHSHSRYLSLSLSLSLSPLSLSHTHTHTELPMLPSCDVDCHSCCWFRFHDEDATPKMPARNVTMVSFIAHTTREGWEGGRGSYFLCDQVASVSMADPECDLVASFGMYFSCVCSHVERTFCPASRVTIPMRLRAQF